MTLWPYLSWTHPVVPYAIGHWLNCGRAPSLLGSKIWTTQLLRRDLPALKHSLQWLPWLSWQNQRRLQVKRGPRLVRHTYRRFRHVRQFFVVYIFWKVSWVSKCTGKFRNIKKVSTKYKVYHTARVWDLFFWPALPLQDINLSIFLTSLPN